MDDVNVVIVVIFVVFPHFSVGLGNHDIIENFIILLQFSFNFQILGHYWEKSSESINKHFINGFDIFNKVKITIFKFANIIHQNGVMISSESKWIYGIWISFDLSIFLQKLPALRLHWIAPIREQKYGSDWIHILSFFYSFESEWHSRRNIGTTPGLKCIDGVRNLLHVSFGTSG